VLLLSLWALPVDTTCGRLYPLLTLPLAFLLFQREPFDASLVTSTFVPDVSNEDAIDVDDVDDAIVPAVGYSLAPFPVG